MSPVGFEGEERDVVHVDGCDGGPARKTSMSGREEESDVTLSLAGYICMLTVLLYSKSSELIKQ